MTVDSYAAGGERSPDSAAVQQLLHVVEGLEEELFSSEARRNDAEVCMPLKLLPPPPRTRDCNAPQPSLLYPLDSIAERLITIIGK